MEEKIQWMKSVKRSEDEERGSNGDQMLGKRKGGSSEER